VRYRRWLGCCALLVVTTSSTLCLPQPHPETLLFKFVFEKSGKRDCCGYCPGPLPEFKRVARATPAGNLLWNSPVPRSFSPHASECEASAWVMDWHNPDDRQYDYSTLGIYFARTSDTLAFASDGNVFALFAANGKLRFAWAANPARGKNSDSYYFDDGTFIVTRGNTPVCSGKTGEAARVFAQCANQFFYFDQEVAAVIEPSGKVVAETVWQARFRDPHATATRDHARIPLGPYQLVLDGMTFMR
jgi:hypothetical protein